MRLVSTALVTALGLSVAACGANTANRTIYSERQPVVTRTNFVLDVNTAGSGALSSGELERLAGWLDALNLGYGDRISIDDPSFTAGASARGAVEALAAQKGLLISELAPVTEGNVPSGAMRVVVSRSTAAVPGCPDWSHRSHTDFQARTSANYGCGVNSTMAAMIADPEDLVRGQSRDGEDQAEASKAIRAYRDKAKQAGGL
ncbi:CpaD family pilus assembly protein [Parasphingorhabdus sp.]|jgi:pilus assembly protein CpaD|uniref:CpaD family pilus assembly protein n=1 Tax=Parasphingorhabdus sp. TaxID=2709688 RepID=UPI003BAE891D